MVEATPLRCMNCDAPIEQGEMKLFAQVCVCGSCYKMAERLYERANKELKLVLVMMKDAIRLSLLEKKLQFKTPDQIQSMKKADLLSRLGELVEQAQERQHDATTSESN